MAKILIVDDDKFTRTVLETIFKQDELFAELDLEVLTAPDGRRGLSLFEEHTPEVVVSDLLMPGLDGFGLCQAIRALPQGGDAHLAVMSGVYRDSAIGQRLEREYGAMFYAKPYQLREMTHRIAELLGEGGAERAEVYIAELSSGELADRPLPAVLLDLLDGKSTGRLLVRRGKIIKTIELLYGHPIAVTSSLRDETLGQLLMAGGVISEAQHRKALARANETRVRMGEALIELGLLTPEQLSSHLTGQLRHKLVSTLRWPTGSWRFEPDPDVHRAQRGGTIDGLATIITGLRDTTSIGDPPPYLREAENLPVYLAARGRELLDVLSRQVAPRIDQLWRDGCTVAELVGYGMERAEVLAALDILLLTDGAEVERPEETSPGSAAYDSGPTMSVTDLSEHSQLMRLSQMEEQERRSEELYDTLFDDDGSALTPLPAGDQPLEVDDDDGVPDALVGGESGVIDVAGMSDAEPSEPAAIEARRARRMLLEEFLRIQGLDHYGVLKVGRDAQAPEVSAAHVERTSKFSLDWYSRFDLGRDYGKLEQIHAAYDEAFEVLMDPAKRDAYDSDEPPGERELRPPPLEAELAFGVAEEALARGEYDKAIAKLEEALARAAEDATYAATLGWAHYLAGDRNAHAADEARRHINEALSRNPDSAIAHAYKGIIAAELGGDDDDARTHLEQALDANPALVDALDAMETIWRRAGEFRPLEKLYRRMIYRTAGRDQATELLLWRRLAELYRTELDDPETARVAFESARRLAPDDAGLHAALHDIDSGAPDRFFERAEVLRRHWRRDPASAGPGVELMRAAEQAARPDAAFMAASALVARGLATPEAEQMYQRYRPRFLIRAQGLFEEETWRRLRHPDDRADIGVLFDLFADAIAAEMPLDLDDLEVDESMRIDEGSLPADFIKVRAYVAHLFGVRAPPVFLRPDFGRQIHVGAVDPPVLLAGDSCLAAPERAELGYRLGRAMSYLFPGRALGGSRPSRFLKHAVLGAWKLATPDATIDDPSGEIAQMQARLKTLGPDLQTRIRAAVAEITRRHRTLNLSRWARGLARTADRAGLLICGDLPAALRFQADVADSAAAAELVDFAIGSEHLSLRASLGLSIDV